MATTLDVQSSETSARVVSGVYAGFAVLVLLAAAVGMFLASIPDGGLLVLVGVVALVVAGLAVPGFFVVQPNRGRVVIVLGRYRGTVRSTGFWWTNPLSVLESKMVSLRIHNFTTEVSKVNDASGNPIEIAAVVVWRVIDTARATFEVHDVDEFVSIQSETAIRHLGTRYPYDDFEDGGVSLLANPDAVVATLAAELEERLASAGVEVVEARISHLAYASEIAEAMLRRQQAAAVVAARRTIVEGAVGMVEDALEMIAAGSIVDLDDERKASMISNLMVVLTSEQQTTPVVNVGSLY